MMSALNDGKQGYLPPQGGMMMHPQGIMFFYYNTMIYRLNWLLLTNILYEIKTVFSSLELPYSPWYVSAYDDHEQRSKGLYQF